MKISVTIARTAGNVSVGSASGCIRSRCKKASSDRGEHHMMVPAGMVPAWMEAPFEVIETELSGPGSVLTVGDRPERWKSDRPHRDSNEQSLDFTHPMTGTAVT